MVTSHAYNAAFPFARPVGNRTKRTVRAWQGCRKLKIIQKLDRLKSSNAGLIQLAAACGKLHAALHL
jgi:hypothetical protein